MFKRVLRGYSWFLSTYKYTSQSVTAGTLWASGDLLSQKFTSDDLDLKRTLIMTSFGSFLAGPLYTFWYTFLDANVFRIVSKAVILLKTNASLDIYIISKPLIQLHSYGMLH